MSLADGSAWEREFGTPEYCEHGIAKGSCSVCATAREFGGAMSKYRSIDPTTEEKCNCDPMYAHRCPKCGGRGWVPIQEPVASPQATRLEGRMKRITLAEENMKRAAHPAAGTTPQAERPAEKLRKAREIDIKNLRFYAKLFEEHKWDTPNISTNVFPATLRDIADRIESTLPFMTAPNTHPEDGGPKEIAFSARAVAPVETPERQHTKDCCLDLDHKGDCKRWMKLPPNSAYSNFKEIHVQDDWCPKAGCVPANPCDITAAYGTAQQTAKTAEQFYRSTEGFGPDTVRWNPKGAMKFAEAFRDKSESLEIESLRATNRELNRRCQALGVNREVGLNPWELSWRKHFMANPQNNEPNAGTTPQATRERIKPDADGGCTCPCGYGFNFKVWFSGEWECPRCNRLFTIDRSTL